MPLPHAWPPLPALSLWLPGVKLCLLADDNPPPSSEVESVHNQNRELVFIKSQKRGPRPTPTAAITRVAGQPWGFRPSRQVFAVRSRTDRRDNFSRCRPQDRVTAD